MRTRPQVRVTSLYLRELGPVDYRLSWIARVTYVVMLDDPSFPGGAQIRGEGRAEDRRADDDGDRAIQRAVEAALVEAACRGWVWNDGLVAPWLDKHGEPYA